MDKWCIYLYWKQGMSLVSFWIASAYSFDAAEKVADEIPLERNKKRGVLFKKLGSSQRIYDRGGHQYYYWRRDKTKATWYPPGREYVPPPEPEPEEETEIPLELEQGELLPDEPFKSVWSE